MNKIKYLYNKFESTLSDLRFAVVIISLFLVALVYGTFMESYHGADYANRLVYKSFWFIGIQVCMFLSIFMATVVRLPLKKRLYGFYTIHTGLITLFIGSFFTYVAGIDGSLELKPNSPARKVVINEDKLRIFISIKDKSNKNFELNLPYTYKEVNLNKEVDNIKVLSFIPFAENKIEWTKAKNQASSNQSSSYQIFNDNVSQEFTLSLSDQSDFQSMQKLGLLSLHYMPKALKDCFIKDSASGFIIWNVVENSCYTPEQRSISVEKTDKDTRFIVFKHNGEFLKFFPDFSPMPIKDNLLRDENSPFRVFSRNLFEKKPHLFLFGNDAVFYRKRSKKWISKTFEQGSKLIKLPWMSFQIRLLKHSTDSYPIEIPSYTLPIHDDGKIIKGNIQAISLLINNQIYWVRSDAPLKLSNGKKDLFASIEKKLVELPYQITLDKFQMNKNPGTNNPASFESYVELLDPRSKELLTKHHVFMNNPLKYDEFTFYQSSYFQMDGGDYGSVFSVNYDPGRFFKYLGSLLIVLGSIWHYFIRRKKKKVNHV